MATMTTTRSVHAAGRRADVYASAMGYESADPARVVEPWRYVGSTAQVPGRGHIPAKPRSRWSAALRLVLNAIKGR